MIGVVGSEFRRVGKKDWFCLLGVLFLDVDREIRFGFGRMGDLVLKIVVGFYWEGG
jgi:hypothetical protein